MGCQLTCNMIQGGPIPLCLPADPCESGCVCQDGYVRTSETDPTCIPREECGMNLKKIKGVSQNH